MKDICLKAAVVASVALAAGCAASSPAAPAASTTPSSSAAPTHAPASPPPAARLTIAQARVLYPELVDPSNRAGDALGDDSADSVPLGQFHADLAADNAALQKLVTSLHSHLWPARVQPYITAMTSTNIPAEIACNKAYALGRTYAAVSTISETNEQCIASRDNGNADTVRSMLGLGAPSS